ncbi:MAG: hypothetical protein LAT82_04905 [Nanoarchaeota archaeon]|nr:hypothetical protein [Nanoarchaeota archaeon]
MAFFQMFSPAVSGTKKLFSREKTEQEFLQSIQRTHTSFANHISSFSSINTTQDITAVETHLLNMVQEFQTFTQQCEQLRDNEIQLFLDIKELVHTQITSIKEVLIKIIAELPISIQVHQNSRAIIEIIQKCIKVIDESVHLLEQTLFKDLSNLQAQFSKQLTNNLLQNTNLQSLEEQRTTLHDTLQQAISTISEHLNELEIQVKEHTLFSNKSSFKLIFEIREELKRLSILIHERVSISNLLILLSLEEELTMANQIKEANEQVQHLREQLSPQLQQSLKQSLEKFDTLIAQIQKQSEQFRQMVKQQSQSFLFKIGKSLALNTASQGGYGVYKISSYLKNNSSEFKLTYKYLKSKIEDTGARSITQFIVQHPEFKEYSWAQMVIVQYSIMNKVGSKMPTWISKFISYPITPTSLSLAQKIVQQTKNDPRKQAQIVSVNTILMTVCISSVLIGVTASKISAEMI